MTQPRHRPPSPPARPAPARTARGASASGPAIAAAEDCLRAFLAGLPRLRDAATDPPDDEPGLETALAELRDAVQEQRARVAACDSVFLVRQWRDQALAQLRAGLPGESRRHLGLLVRDCDRRVVALRAAAAV